MTSPPNTQGFILLRALSALDELGIVDPLGAGIGALMKIFRDGNDLRSRALADPRHANVDVEALVHGELGAVMVGGLPADGRGAWRHRWHRRGGQRRVRRFADPECVSLLWVGADRPRDRHPVPEPRHGFSLDKNSPNVIAPQSGPRTR